MAVGRGGGDPVRILTNNPMYPAVSPENRAFPARERCTGPTPSSAHQSSGPQHLLRSVIIEHNRNKRKA